MDSFNKIRVRLDEDKEKWKNLTINQMKTSKIDESIKQYNIDITNIKTKIPDPDKDEVFKLLNNLAITMNKNIPVIQVLSSSSIQERNWREFFKLLNIPYSSDILDSLKFSAILDNSAISFEADKIHNIVPRLLVKKK